MTFTQTWGSEGARGDRESEGPVWLKRGVEVRGQGLNSSRQGRGETMGSLGGCGRTRGFILSEMESRREGFEGEVTRPYLILSVTPAVFLRVSCRSKTKNCGDPVGRIPSEKGGFIHRGVGRP